MAIAIDFDNEVDRFAVEIDDVFTEWFLAIELQTATFSAAQVLPEYDFSESRVIS